MKLAQRLGNLSGAPFQIGVSHGTAPRLSARLAGLSGPAAAVGVQSANPKLAGRLDALHGEAARIGVPPAQIERLVSRLGNLSNQPRLADPVPVPKPMTISERMAKLYAAMQPRPKDTEEFVAFGEWLPDQPAYRNTGATVANNVIPLSGGDYGPMNGLAAYSNAVAARVQGGLAVLDSAGNVHIFAGTIDKLYRLVSGTLTFEDVSIAGGYATGVDERWSFAQYGDRIVACNFANDTQSYVIGTSVDFAVLAAAAPRARYAAVIRDFLVLANTFDGTDGNKPQRVWWPDIANPANWPTPGSAAAQAAQSDFQDLVGPGGWIQGLVGGLAAADGVVIQEEAVIRMSYVGPPAVFQFDVVEGAQGTHAPSSVVQHGAIVFYLSPHGFRAFDGSNSKAIGAGKVDRYFLSQVDPAYIYRIWGAIDPTNDLVVWLYPGPGNSGGTPNKVIAFNFVTGRWAVGDIEAEILLPAKTFGYTLETLDTVNASIDALPASLDSRLWTGGAIEFGAFDTAHKLGYFTGANLAATIETGEIGGQGRLLSISGIRPLVDGGSPMASVGYRSTPQAALTYTTATSPADDGLCKQRIQTRFARARVTTGAGQSWTHAHGVEVAMQLGDGR